MIGLHLPIERAEINKAWKVYRSNHELYGDFGFTGFCEFLGLYKPNWEPVISGNAAKVYLPQSAASKISVLANYQVSYHLVLLKVAEAKHRVIDDTQEETERS